MMNRSHLGTFADLFFNAWIVFVYILAAARLLVVPVGGYLVGFGGVQRRGGWLNIQGHQEIASRS